MTIWVDADACPVVIREVLTKAAIKRKVKVNFVANQRIKLPPSPFITMRCVPSGFDVADNEIVQRVSANDLVITSDIPLAAEVIEKDAEALNTRGEMYSKDIIKQRLNIRDFMDAMRTSGVQTGGPPPLTQTERKDFADHLDRWLTKNGY